MRAEPKLSRIWRVRPAVVEIIIVLTILALALALTFNHAMRAKYDRDEDQFIASARLLADHSLLPYQDYPYFHTPYLTIIYALILPLTDHYNLLVARVFSLLCGLAAILLLIIVTRDLFRRHPAGLRLWAVATVALLLLPNPLFAYANQKAWNHSFPVLFTLLAFVGCYYSGRRKHALWWLFAAGLCLGAAVGTRLSLITALPAFLVALILYGPS
jgi:4-amino-4-deoxy-L-arabinose transferase-like glycosyltransferase